MIESSLAQLGLNSKEIKVFLKLLAIGASRASIIAYHLNLPRSTVQNILLNLEEERLVTKSLHKNIHIFAAIDPEDLPHILEIKKREVDSQYLRSIEDIKLAIPQLKQLMKEAKNVPRVKFYQGKDAVRKVLFDTLTSKTELKDFANIDAMFQYAQDINDEYVKEREKAMKGKKPVTKRSLLLDTPFAREVYESGKYSPKSHKGYKWINSQLYPFAIETNIYDGKVSYITYVENSFVGVIIENEHIYQMHDSMWNLIWDNLPEPEEQ